MYSQYLVVVLLVMAVVVAVVVAAAIDRLGSELDYDALLSYQYDDFAGKK